MADETPPENETTEPQPNPRWEKREFRINTEMKSIIRATIPVTEAQIAQLKRKLKKLQYGSSK